MIVVYGSINIDLIGHAPRLMGPGETVLGTRLDISPGGKGANQALAARRAGARVRLVGCVGEDGFATQALSLLDAAGVDLSSVHRTDAHTGTALIVVDAAGENMITMLPGANSALSVTALDGVEFSGADTLLLQLESPLDGVVVAAERARAAGARVIVNLAPYAPVPAALLGAASVVVVNETELTGTLQTLDLPGGSVADGLTTLASRFDAIAVATLGPRGAMAVAPDGTTTAVSGRSITPLDTTGAGDTFVGYLAASLADGMALSAALERANVAAALACLAAGAQPAIPDADAVAAALDAGA